MLNEKASADGLKDTLDKVRDTARIRQHDIKSIWSIALGRTGRSEGLAVWGYAGDHGGDDGNGLAIIPKERGEHEL